MTEKEIDSRESGTNMDDYQIVEGKSEGLERVAEAIATQIVEEELTYGRLKKLANSARKCKQPMERIFSREVASKDPLEDSTSVCALGGLECEDGDCRTCGVPILMKKHSATFVKITGKW